ncbi:MAG: CHAT domain-containing protein [Betaproteobacteria bacterium]|nr:CHAT domain-containing protein [Betaproteobacteria bacterium]
MDARGSAFAEEVARLQALWNERPQDAVARARELLGQASPQLPAELPVAHGANLLGVFFFDRGFDAEARRACNLALELLERSAQQGAGLASSIHNNLGQLDERAGELESAERHLERALALRPDADLDGAEGAFTADNLGSVLVRRGKLDRAEELHRHALRVLQGLGPRYLADVATVLGNLGLLYRRRDETARARATLLRAIHTHLLVGSLESSDASIPLVNLIALLLKRDEEQRADEMIDWLLRAAGGGTDVKKHRIARALLELGSEAFRRAQLGPAERLATRALDLLEAIYGSAAPQTVRALRLLANVQAHKGNIEPAEQGLLRLLAMPGFEPEKSAELLIDLGKTLRERGPGSFPAAIGMFERAIRLLRERGAPEPQRLASALGNLGYVCFLRDDEHRADELYTQALALGDANVLGNEYPWLLYNQALLHYHLAKHEAARDGMERALQHWQASLGPSHPFIATVHANLALVHWARDDFGAAQRAFVLARQLGAGDFQRTLLVGSERERLEAAHVEQSELYRLVSFCFAAGARGEVARATAELLLERKAGVLDALAFTHARVRARLDAVAREQLDRVEELRRRIAHTVLSAQLFGDRYDPRALAALQAEEDRLQTEISHEHAIGLGALEPVTLSAVQGALSERTVLVEYLRWSRFDPVRRGSGTPWREQRYAAMVLRDSGDPCWFDLGEANAIDGAAHELRALLRDLDSDTDAVSAAAADLYERLWGAFDALLAGASLLLVAPDGELNLLPFAILGAPMLAERYVVSHLTSGRELLRSSPPAAADAAVVIVVDPDFDAVDVSGAPVAAASVPSTLRLEPLPGTRDEAEVIAALFPRCRVLAGADANVSALKAIERPALLHVATHGWFTPAGETPPLLASSSLRVGGEYLFIERALRPAAANPMLHAGLALAGANRSAPGRSSGFVTAAELAALDLRGTELVVLSACDTGLGAIPAGGEFAGLRRAFAIAGAAAQVISLWEVDEDATTALMESFYRRLLDGTGRAEALQQAQHEIRRRPRWAHPGIWAAFVAWGAAGALSHNVLAPDMERLQ